MKHELNEYFVLFGGIFRIYQFTESSGGPSAPTFPRTTPIGRGANGGRFRQILGTKKIR